MNEEYATAPLPEGYGWKSGDRLEPLKELLLDRHGSLPEFDVYSRIRNDLPEPLPELIHGLLRKGHKMLLAGSSKAGKSFLLIELCIAISEGRKWLGFRCEQGRVLYVNLEIDRASCLRRIRDIFDAQGIEPEHEDALVIWNLRGYAEPLAELVPELIRRIREENIAAVVIDPIYKVSTGDENSASDMAALCNGFDRICRETGAAVICCHHHSKGLQGGKRPMDRASGSGVFARDPDALLDIIRLEPGPELQRKAGGATAWRMEGTLREFGNFPPVDFWFEHPLHRLDTTGELASVPAEGSRESNLAKSPKRTGAAERRKALDEAYDSLSGGGPVEVEMLAGRMDVSAATVRNYVKERPEEYWCRNSLVGRQIRK